MKEMNVIRHENLLVLIREAGTQERLSELAEVSHVYLNQIKNRRPDPTTGKIRNVGNQLARKLEKGMDKPEGWMDRDHSNAPESSLHDWPFEDVSLQKVRALSKNHRSQLEGALLLTAAQLGLDVSNKSPDPGAEFAA